MLVTGVAYAIAYWLHGREVWKEAAVVWRLLPHVRATQTAGGRKVTLIHATRRLEKRSRSLSDTLMVLSCILKMMLTALAGVAIMVSVCILFDSTTALERTAEAAHEAFVTGDADALFELASPGEVETLGLTAAKLDRLLNGYVLNGVGELKTSPNQEHYENDFPSAEFTVQRRYLAASERTMQVRFTVSEREGGRYIKNLVWALVEARASLENKQLVDLLERDHEKLDGTGIKAIYQGGHSLFWLHYVASERDVDRRYR